MLTLRDIADGLYAGGVGPGDCVMLHSSYKSLGGVAGGPDTVLDAFLDVLGERGTLLAPTLLFKGAQHPFLHQYPDDIDLRTTPSQTGVLSEMLRNRRGAERSNHPTHPVAAYGARAAELCGRHELDDTAVGRNSPWALNAAATGWIVLLGVTHACNTTLHHLEELHTDWLLPQERVAVSFVDMAGRRRTACMRPYTPGLPRDYPKVEPILLQAGLQRNITIGDATVRLVRAAALVERIGQEVRKDQYFLLKDPSSKPRPACAKPEE